MTTKIQKYCQRAGSRALILIYFLSGLVAASLVPRHCVAQHTFSIVAVDTASGQIGSAGASCIDDSHIISVLLPGRAAANVQALWQMDNLLKVETLLNSGFSPAATLDSVLAYDSANGGATPDFRQFGIVDLDSAGGARSLGYTGDSCISWAGHVTGYDYAIQGNILMDSTVILDMEQAFQSGSGPLHARLMAALQAAKRPGADTRCLADSVSAYSAFIRLAKPNDAASNPWLSLTVGSILPPQDPIDSLKTLYDVWLNPDRREAQPTTPRFRLHPNPVNQSEISIEPATQAAYDLELLDGQGRRVMVRRDLSGSYTLRLDGLAPGLYVYRLTSRQGGRPETGRLILE